MAYPPAYPNQGYPYPSGIVVAPPVMSMAMAGPVYADMFDVFARNKGLFVKEKVNLAEVFTGCDMEKTFTVSTWDPALGAENAKAGRGPQVLKMKETSDCCQRIICGRHRAFEIGIVPSEPIVQTYHPGLENRDTMYSHPDGMVIRRPFKCTICCWNRPVVYMTHNTIGRFATVTNPCNICSFHFDIHAASDTDGGVGAVAPGVIPDAAAKWYIVNGSRCQPGAICFCPCGECARVRLQVYDGRDEGMAHPIGEVARVFPGCCKAAATNADDFTLAFPTDASPVKRASLVSAIVLLNYLQFEDRKNKNDNNGAALAFN